MFRKDILILFVFALFFFQSKLRAQQLKHVVVVDTLNFSISFDSTKITLNKTVKDGFFWLDILSRDTILVSSLQRKFRLEAPSISIFEITEIGNQKSEYEFRLYCRPSRRIIEIQKDSLPIQLIQSRPVHYSIKLASLRVTLIRRISEVELTEIEI